MTYARRALASDIDELLPLCRAFHAESPHHRALPFSEERVSRLIGAAVDDTDWLAAVACADSGAIVGMALYFCSHAFFSDALEVFDLTFWVDPASRGTRAALQLMRMVIKWGEAKGAARINQGVLTQINHDQAVRFFEAMGFVSKGIILVR